MPASRSSRAKTVDAYALHQRYTIPADPEALPGVVDAVVRVVAEHCAALIAEPAVALVVQEAMANAVVHGCGADPSKQVQCELGCDPHLGLLVVVRDPGPGFDYAALAPVGGDNGLADHGRGIYLIHQLMDDVRFARNGAEIQMRKFPAGGSKAVA